MEPLNFIENYWTDVFALGPTKVGVIGLGPGGRALARSMAQHYPVIAFDHGLKAQGKTENNIVWTASPNDLVQATHIIVAEPHSRQRTGSGLHVRMNDIMWALSIVRAAVNGKRAVTVIIACVLPIVGAAQQFLKEFQDKGCRAGVAPQLPLIPGDDDAANPLPKLIGGVDDYSLTTIRNLYGKVFGDDELIPIKCIDKVEHFTDHDILLRSLRLTQARQEKQVAANGAGSIENQKPAKTCSIATTRGSSIEDTIATEATTGSSTKCLTHSDSDEDPHDSDETECLCEDEKSCNLVSSPGDVSSTGSGPCNIESGNKHHSDGGYEDCPDDCSCEGRCACEDDEPDRF